MYQQNKLFLKASSHQLRSVMNGPESRFPFLKKFRFGQDWNNLFFFATNFNCFDCNNSVVDIPTVKYDHVMIYIDCSRLQIKTPEIALKAAAVYVSRSLYILYFRAVVRFSTSFKLVIGKMLFFFAKHWPWITQAKERYVKNLKANCTQNI